MNEAEENAPPTSPAPTHTPTPSPMPSPTPDQGLTLYRLPPRFYVVEGSPTPTPTPPEERERVARLVDFRIAEFFQRLQHGSVDSKKGRRCLRRMGSRCNEIRQTRMQGEAQELARSPSDLKTRCRNGVYVPMKWDKPR